MSKIPQELDGATILTIVMVVLAFAVLGGLLSYVGVDPVFSAVIAAAVILHVAKG